MRKDKLLLPLFILLIIPFLSFSQEETLPKLEAYFSAMIIEDMDTSIEWYSKLGFDVLNNIALEERGIKQANLSNGNVHLELLELKSAVKQEDLLVDYPRKTKIQGFFKFGFSVSDFDAWVNYLKELNLEFNGDVVTDRLSGKKMVIINDPDGNRVQIFEK